MGKSKVKTFLISFLVAAVAACLSVAFVACSGGGEEKDTHVYNVGEEGVYYYDKDADTEYLMTLQSGTYMISLDSAMGYSGTYSYDEEEKTVAFKGSDGSSFEAAFSDDVMQLAIAGTPYTFLKKVNYTVTLVDGSDVSTQSVTYGKQAAEPAADTTRIFLGWYEDAAFTTQYKFDTAVTGNITLYAYYIDIDATIANYDVSFVIDGETVYTTKTQNGVVYDMYDADGILGWWVSDTNSEGELTYKYDGGVLNESTKLFAVKEGSLGASVYADRVTWERSVSSAEVYVDGEQVTSSAAGTYFEYDFSSLPTGAHEVLVRVSGYGDETLVYVSNALARVSNFSVYGDFLVYNGVENAQYYCVSVECGNASHSHELVYNGSSLSFDFSSCEMGPEGIKFTVYAYAQGYAESVSETFVYLLKMSDAEVKIDSATDTALWDVVYDMTGSQAATEYEVYVNGAYAATVTDTQYSLKNYEKGDTVSVQVKPVVPRYYSELSEAASYEKATLKAPEITGINTYTVSWSPVEEATNYIIYVNGARVETVSSDINEYALSTDEDFVPADYYVITVKAVNAENTNENSQESDAVYATDDEMAPLLTYADGTVYWQYAMAAGTYYVSVNGGGDTAVTGKNSFDVTFTKSGENTIEVYFRTEEGNSAVAKLSVTAYAVIFDSAGGTLVDTIYVAKGDTLRLSTPDYEYGAAEFMGWYTLPNPDESLVVSDYEGDGVLVANGSVFTGNTTLILYASWEVEKMRVIFNTGDYGTINGLTETEDLVPINITKYSLLVPECTDNAYLFLGWYTEPDGKGTRYTDENGDGTRPFNNTNITTLYAYWIQLFTFTATTYEGVAYAEVSGGKDINLAPDGVVTIPATCEIKGVEYTVGLINSGAFNSCSGLITINIPDTVVYIPTSGNGYTSGSGAFASTSSIQAVNMYETDSEENTTREIMYYSYDGVLYAKNSEDGVTLTYYPRGKTNTTFVIPEYVSNEYEYELSGTNLVKVYRPVTAIAERALYTNSKILSITIPATVSLIDIQAFQSADFETVTFNDAVTSGYVSAATTLAIESKAFQSCTSLTSVNLPRRLSSFSSDAFASCSKFTYVSVTDGGAYSSSDGMLYNSTGSTLVYCPVGREGDIIVSGGVTRIEDGAFENCTKITSVTIPTSVTYIGENAFNGCKGITSLTFEDRANANLLEIQKRAFYGCTSITEVKLPVGLETVGEEAFAGCTKLTYVYVDVAPGATVDQIDFAEGAFGTTVKSLEFGTNVPLLENFLAIFGNASLTTVTIASDNSNYKEDDSGVIYGVYEDETTILMWAPDVNGEYKVLDSCMTIAANAFEGRTRITKITVAKTVKRIGSYAFYGCSNLSTVEFETGSALETIGDYAFASSGITSITIPASVQYMGEYDSKGALVSISVFDSCSSLGAINVEEGNEYFASTDGILYLMEDGKASQLIVSPVNNTKTDITIPSSVTKVWDNAFYGNTKLTSVAFAENKVDGDIEFGENTFYSCTALKSVTLPTGLETIPAMMFGKCSALTTITIPYTVTTIGAQVFYMCTALSAVTFEELPEDADIDEYALTFEDTNGSATLEGTFYDCVALIEIAIPDRTVELGESTFGWCNNLEKVVIGANVTDIPQYTFRYCYKLYSVTFGNDPNLEVQTEKIGTQAFYYVAQKATQQFNLVLPSSMREIKDYAFSYCYLSSLELNEGLETIGNYILSEGSANRTSITTLTIPSTMKTIGNGAFYYSTKLTSVTFAEGIELEAINTSTFRGCTSLETISLPASIKTIGNYAFYGCTSLKTIEFGTLKAADEEDDPGLSQITSFGDYSFQNCTALESFAFPETGAAITLGKYMFKGCKNLANVTFSSGVTSLGDAFSGCYSIQSIDTENCTAFGADENGLPVLYTKTDGEISGTLVYVFGDISGEFKIPETVTAIEASAFLNQVTLTSVKIPSVMSSIGAYAFDGCLNLSNVEFYQVEGAYASDLTVGNAVFRQTAISEIDFSGFTSVSLGAMVFAYCPNFKEVTLSANTSLKAGTSAALANSGSFSYCDSLETVILGGTTAIPAYTFFGCTSLSTIAATEESKVTGTFDLTTVTSIGAAAFEATAAEKVILSTSDTLSVTQGTGNNSGAFSNMESLESVVLGGLKTIPQYTFYGCSALVSMGLTENDLTVDGTPAVNLSGVTATAIDIFYGCSSMTLLIHNAGEEVGTAAYYGCSALATVGTYSGGIIAYTTGTAYLEGVSLGKAAFAATAIENVILDSQSSLTAGSGASAGNYGPLGNCTSLLSVDLGGITSIPDYAFDASTALIAISGSSNITSIGNYAFDGCTNLYTVGDTTGLIDISGVTSLGTYAFRNCEKIEKVLVSEDVSISAYDFYGDISLIALATSLDGMYIGETPVINLTGVTMAGSSTASSGGDTFYGATALEALILGSNVHVGIDAFTSCSSLRTVAQSESDFEIGTGNFAGIQLEKGAFAGTALEKVIMDSNTAVTAGSGTGVANNGAFGMCEELVSVEFGGLDTVVAYMFYGCTALEEVVLGSVTTVNQCAFNGCTALSTMAQSEEALVAGTADLSGLTLAKAAFSNTAIEKLIISASTSITAGSGTGTNASPFGENTKLETVVYGHPTLQNYSFYGCTNLRTLAASEEDLVDGVVDLTGITATGTFLFYQCTGFTNLVLDINASIGQAAFSGCSSLVTVGDEEGIAKFDDISLGKGAFSGCGFTTLVLSETVSMTAGSSSSAGSSAGSFTYCDKITTIDLGGVAAVPDCSFANCKQLVAVTGFENVRSLGDSAFYNCYNMTTIGEEEGVVDLSGVTFVDTDVFSYCDALTTFKADGNSVYFVQDSILYDYDYEIISVPGALSGAVTIADGTTRVNDFAFRGNMFITEITIPASVTEIGSYAFAYCTALTKVTIEGEGLVLGESSFRYDDALAEIVTENGLGTLGNYALEYCSSLTEVYIGSEAETIGNYALAYCDALEKITMEPGVTYFGQYMCRDDLALEEVNIPYTVTEIAYCAFWNCESLATVTFDDVPEGNDDSEFPLLIDATSTGNGAFSSCTSLTEIELPSRLSGFGLYSTTGKYGHVFANDTALETVTIKGSFDSDNVGYYIFKDCTALTTVYIESGVEAIGQYMFSGCTSLENVYIADTVTDIGQYAFEGCTGLGSLIIPENVDTIGTNAFDGMTQDATIYFETDYKTATMSWLSYSATTYGSEATTEKWKLGSEANFAFYYEKPANTSSLPDMGVNYWYYDASGDIVEWTVAGLQK